MPRNPTILFVGESPPSGAPPDFRPFDCASGSRLAKVLGLVDREALLSNVPFANVFQTPTGVRDCPPWDPAIARHHGQAIRLAHRSTVAGRTTFVALGDRAKAALGRSDLRPCTWHREDCDVTADDLVAVPHPSGQSQALNTEEQRQEIRRAILPDLCAATNTTLRPWHFRLDESAVLADVGLALCPLDPALGGAAAVICGEVWRAVTGPASVALGEYKRSVDVPLPILGRWCRDGREVVQREIEPLGVPARSFAAEVRSRHKFAARTLPRPPSAEVRAAYARLVALGVAS